MSRLPLTFACAGYDRMQALMTGEVQPDGIDLNFIPIDNPRELFDRMVGRLEFDLSEMSSSEYITRFAAGSCPFIALPVVASRVFRHGFIAVDRRAITKPTDLAGKRIGVQLYSMTAAIWIRGILQHHYGVDLSGVEWVEGAIDAPHAHGKPTVLPPLKPIRITQNNSGKSLSQLLEAGEIAATIGADLPPAFGSNPNVVRLFPDFRQAEKDYYKQTGIFPIMHLIVVRRDVLEKHPFIASSLYHAFCESKALAYKRMRYLGTLRYMLPWMTAELDEIQQVFGGDPWPYGVEPNRKAIEALVQYLVDQSMIARPVPVDDLFTRVFERTETPKHPAKT
jgi:4,5-dihydroxyphthalate decarboxylase